MRDQNPIRRIMAGILLLILFHEWIHPLSALSNWTDVYAITPIFITIAGVLAVDVLNIHRILTWIVKLLISLFAVNTMFYGAHLLQTDRVVDFAIIIVEDFLHILMGEWNAVSGEGRTLLFIGAWSAVVCWLYAVILYRRLALYITVLTVVYLLILQTWLGLDTTKGAILAVIAGLLLHGLSVLPSLESIFGLRSKHTGWPLRWVVSSIVLVSITISCGLFLSSGQEKSIVRLPAPLLKWSWHSLEAFTPFSMQSFPGYTAEMTNNAQRSGYSMTDSTLGGSVKSDDSIAFLANTERPDAYWRGESKTVYDGKGWSNLANDLFGYEIGAVIPDILSDQNHSTPSSTMIIQEVFPLSDYPSSKHTTLLLANGAIRSVDQVHIEHDDTEITLGPITIDRIEGKYTLQGNESNSLTSYSLQSSAPITSDSAKLIKTDQDAPVPLAISVSNLQLPEQLPERVAQLAHSIADEFDSTWEKANAIERYLSEHYRYTLSPKPTTHEGDFVDQFLFEQREGYCDYFSTAMTVMLRSIDIPARWVKGFAPGEIIEADENSFLLESSERLHSSLIKVYPVMIRNRDAHSWVEVYISGIGWTSYDPTPTNVAAMALDTGGDETSLTGKFSTNPLLKYISYAKDIMLDKRFHASLLLIAAILVVGLTAQWIIRSSLVRRCVGTIYLRLLLLQYAWGMTTIVADLRLLERLLTLTFARYGHLMHAGETMRESVLRGYYPNVLTEALLEVVAIYELARYGPEDRKRIPYRSIEACWRKLI